MSERRFTNDELEAAMAAAKAFVAALAREDEGAARALCYGPSLGNWDLSNGVVGLWRQGPSAPFFGRMSPTQTARVLDGVGEGDPSVVCFGFVIASEHDETQSVVLINGPRPAIAIGMIQGAPNVWQVWGQPPEDEWRAARYVKIPLPATGVDADT
jgi:hypothetical protein